VIKRINNFFFEIRAEMQKVTWPTREELIGSTGVVLMTMFILSAFIAFSDFFVSIFMRAVLR